MIKAGNNVQLGERENRYSQIGAAGFGALLLLGLGQPTAAPAVTITGTCNVTDTVVVTYLMGSKRVEVDGPSLGFDRPSIMNNCAVNMATSADCKPGVDYYYLRALATTGQLNMNPRCVWTCDCGTVTVTSADGLPVELLEFSVDAAE